MELFNYLFNFVIFTSRLFNIDESHSLKHSMDVFYLSNKIYESELGNNSDLSNHKNIIDTVSILHDMCDKKYMDEQEGIKRITDYLDGKLPKKDIDISIKIMSTMSYSTIKKYGFPDLGEYQLAYNIVREADLLASYDFDRCIMYQMLKNNEPYDKSFNDALNIFDNRVFKYTDDKLFTTKYAQNLSKDLHNKALKRISSLNKMLNIKKIY
jgi:HD superfamily phosphodiesterase